MQWPTENGHTIIHNKNIIVNPCAQKVKLSPQFICIQHNVNCPSVDTIAK